MAAPVIEKKRFFCREWAFMKLSHCLEQRPASKTCGALIVGGPGSGKTALCAELAWPSTTASSRHQRSLNRRLLARHFCQARSEASLSPAQFVRSLVAQILQASTDGIHLSSPTSPTASTTSVPSTSKEAVAEAYAERLRTDPDIHAALQHDVLDRDPDDAFKKALLFPLLEVEPPKNCLFLLVDSIDEGQVLNPPQTGTRDSRRENDNVSRTIAELLANHHHLFPQWLLLVCTARRQSKTISRMFTGFRKISLDDLRKSQVVRDVQQYILARLDQEDALRQHISRDTAEMLNQLHIKSNGCFLYLEKVLDGVAENFIVLREVREIPGTLNGLYLWLCQRLFSRKQFAKVQPLLNVILAAKLPITQDILYKCVKTAHTTITIEDFNRRLHLLRRVISVSRAGALMLFHHSFAEWLLDVKHCTQKYLCSATEGHAMLSAYYTLRSPELNPDEICVLGQHLQRVINNISGNNCTLDAHTLQVLWMIGSRAPIEQCYLDSPECIMWPRQDTKLLRLLVDAGAKPSEKIIEDEPIKDPVSSSQVSQDVSPVDESPGEPLTELLGENGDINQADSCGRTVLHTLAADGNASLLELALAACPQAKLEATDRHGQTPLNLAARHGYADVVRVLLAAGASADHADCDGWTALRAAAWGGHTQVHSQPSLLPRNHKTVKTDSDVVVEMLLEHGAMVDCADWDQRTALRAAAWGGHEDIVKALLQHGADVNRTDDEGRTALIAAAYMGHSEIVEHLLDYGAKIDHADSDGRTALSVAALCVPSNHGYAKVVTILLERGAAVDHQDKDGMTPLLVAAFEGHRDVCELLLEYEADVDHCDATGRTPLWAAASMGHGSVVALLLFWGCYVDSIDNEGRTVLSVAAAQGGTDVVKQLLDRGLDEQHRDNSGWTPLHYAAFEGHLDVCEALLEAGAKVDEADNDGKGALMLAAQEGHTSLVERLLEHHAAPIDQHAHDGKTALRLAALEGHYETVRVLLKHNADMNAKDADGRSTLYILALENRLAMAKFLLENANPDVESRDSEGRTALHVSAWQGHEDMVALLLTAGNASVNACDNENRTPLHSAAWQGHAAIVRLLLEHGATPDHTCNQGATALGIAAQEGHEHCVRALLNHGADPNHSDHCGRNAIKVAAKSGHDTVVRLLEEHSANQRSLRPAMNGGGSSSATSVTSNSTAETKPSSAILNPLSTQYSPAESPDSTKRRSCVSLGNNSSNSKSSSNLTGSTKSDQGKFSQNPMVNQVIKAPLSFTQQLQQCSRGAKSRPLSKLLSPLKSEPQSPIYASPPHSPLSDSLIPYSPTNTSPPSAQTAASVIQSQLGVSLLTGNQSIQYKPHGGFNKTPVIYEPIEIKTELIDRNDSSKPFELTNEMLGLKVNKEKKANGYDDKRNSADPHFTRDTHMRIILGNSGAGVGRNVKHTDHVTPSPNPKPKRNGLVSNPAMRLVAGVRNGFENATNRNKPITTRVNGFQWKAEARKETPL
ncbi:ankyrin repeat domain-containing protein 50-like isoform X1 [Microplitis mediator]|uniref:ankyrin repeat domain-containing protein 50 isoform X1 n=1 Tax=Microplitis demolitor TaxID=69319 RepID=UPI0006D51843|nr:ankyrin repeat domain-containing protein 50 isoform X1 [Microplitis demolitor]XP_053593271.1 ankyrin repeat domain-containing protein 50 isoform X1 [Microplitis demolitor]XP_057319596.1 ankyrin repeat domain-containing protein 50-like isoform X1 [Microplitis mediator]XP_057319597.1 ankyrin repeat domain-containing protein 50-like isoform X1 [Microplitis mediator]XP_057319598.1 ankyrin repeat domain-containing protein 50-like isoform X1 [Microplitis mediator]XP_057319599.1 ankyrin repeat dom